MKVAVVLFNLGGPDGPEAVRPFLFNLFNDEAIIRSSALVRWILAQTISRRRAGTARDIYAQIGGGSPLLANTQAQADALERELAPSAEHEFRCFIAMRYWHPFSDETAREVKAYAPDFVVLLPLYPQFSTTTSGSSLRAWSQAAAAVALSAPARATCCYPTLAGFVAAMAERIAITYQIASANGPPRLLFSAHGLPERIVQAGDPYQWQVEQTAAAVVAKLAIAGLDWVVCYQSRVGPLKWIEPATDDSIRQAGADGRTVVVAPIAFVSEHSETLVELDIEYSKLAKEAGVPAYHRVPTVSTDHAFIAGLAKLVADTMDRPREIAHESGGRFCPVDWKDCPCRG